MSHRANLAARILLPVIAISLLSACIYRPGGIAPSNIPLDGRAYRVVGEVASTDSCIRLFGILPISGSNTIRQALDAAIRKRSADALIDITVEGYVQYWILFTRYVTAVRGTAIQFEDRPGGLHVPAHPSQ
jgi:hypothetical protein